MSTSPDDHSTEFPAPAWPQQPELFTSGSHCPSCFSPLGGTRCGWCGLDVAGPLGVDVFAASENVARAIDERTELLNQMRSEQVVADAAVWAAHAAHTAQLAQAPAPAQHGSPVAAAAPSEAWVSPATAAADPAFAPPQPSMPAPTHPVASGSPPEPTKPRRSGVQIFLLTVGVVLVSIMAVFFVLLAYLVASIEARSILTAIAAVAAFGIAWLLRRKQLTGTAEGIAALAVVLALLNAWLIRANGLFGSTELNAQAYTGIAFLVLAALLFGAFRLTRLRVMSVAAAALLPLGFFFLVAGVSIATLPDLAHLFGLLAAGASGLAWPLLRNRVAESRILRLIAYTATGLGISSPLAIGGNVWTPTLFMAGFTILWGLTATVGYRYRVPAQAFVPAQTSVPAPVPVDATAPPTRPALINGWVAFAATSIGIFAGLTAVLAAFSTDDAFISAAREVPLSRIPVLWVGLAPLYTTILGLGAAWFLAGRVTPAARRAAIVLTVPLTIVAGVALVPSALVALGQVFALPVRALTGRPLDPFEKLPVAVLDDPWWALAGVLVTAALVAIALVLLKLLARYAVVPAALGMAGLLGAAASAGSTVGVAVALTVLAVAGILALWLLQISPGIRTVVGIGTAIAALGVYSAGWLSPPVWPFAVGVAAALLLTLRQALGFSVRRADARPRAVLLSAITGVAVVLVLTALWRLTQWLVTIGAVPDQTNDLDHAFWPTAVAASLLVLGAFAGPWLPRSDARVVNWVTLVVVLIGAPVLLTLNATGGTDGLIVGTTAGTIILVLLVAAGVSWQLRRPVSGKPEALVLAIITPLALAWLAHMLVGAYARVTDVSQVSQIATAIAALAASAFALVALTNPSTRRNRIGWDAATLFVVVLVVAAAVVSGGSLAWLALLIAACVPLLVASGDGDLFTGSSARRHVAWLGLPISVGSLWQALFVREVSTVEWYTIPLAATLLAVAALIAWRRPTAGHSSSGRNALVIAGAAIAIIPSVFVSGSDSPWRPIILIAAGGLLALASLDLPRRFAGIEVRLVALVAGLAAVGVPGYLRASSVVRETGAAGWQLEAWIAPGVIVAAVVTVVFALRNQTAIWSLAVIYPIALLVAPELVAVMAREHATARILIVIGLVGATHVVAALMTPRPLATMLRWASAAALAVVGPVGLVFAAAKPFELITMSIAAALIIAGIIRLQRNSTRRTWPELGMGTAVLLVPSYLADFWVPPLWRAIGLGAVCLVILLVAVWRKWQAPLLIAGVVLVLHALAQLWPWISSVYVNYWWLWLGIGGVMLIIIAATYEKRMRDFKSVALRIRSLR